MPGVMALGTEVRLLPGMRREDVGGAFTALARRVSRETGADLQLEFDQPPNDWLPATLVAPDDPLVRRGRRAGRFWVPTPPVRSSPAPRTRRGLTQSRICPPCLPSDPACCAAHLAQ